MKKKLIFIAIIFLAGTLIAYPAVDYVIEDIIDRDLPDVQSQTEHIAVVDYIWMANTNAGPDSVRSAWMSSTSHLNDPPRKALIIYTRFDSETGPQTYNASDFSSTAENIKDRFADSYMELISITLPALFGYESTATMIDENETSGDDLKYASVTYTNFLDVENVNAIENISGPYAEASTCLIAYTSIKDISSFYGVENTEATVVYIKPLEVPLLKLKLSIIGAVIFTLPFIVYVFGKEFYPRIKRRVTFPIKKRWLALFLFAVTVSFIVGCIYAYFMMAPLFIRFLYTNAAGMGVQATYSIYEFVSFVGLLTLIFGFIFEFPIVTFVLNRAGIISKEFLTKYRKHAYVGFFILGALITPPDVISQIIVAIPMIIFFEISIILVKIFGKNVVKPVKFGELLSDD